MCWYRADMSVLLDDQRTRSATGVRDLANVVAPRLARAFLAALAADEQVTAVVATVLPTGLIGTCPTRIVRVGIPMLSGRPKVDSWSRPVSFDQISRGGVGLTVRITAADGRTAKLRVGSAAEFALLEQPQG